MDKDRLQKARRIVRTHLHGSLGGGFIPIPGIDLATVFGIQMSMLYSLSKLYGIEFKKTAASASIASLLGSVIPYSFTNGFVGTFLTMIPLVGPALAAFSMSAFSAAFTYAIGRVYIQHFETGGNFLNFDPVALKEFFREAFAEGQKEAKNLA